MERSLVAFDTDQIKQYVFATARLKEIRGASALLDSLNRQDMVEQAGGEPIFAHGGGGLFVVEKARTADVVDQVGRVYRQKTAIASVTGVAADLPADYQSNIKPALDLLRYRLRRAKDGRHNPQTLVSHPLLHFCDSCGVQPAVGYFEDDLLCHSCQLKREMNQAITFLSDGGDTVRNLQYHMSPVAEHILDWFHVTMRLTVMGNIAKGLPSHEELERVPHDLERIKWFLWHGNAYQALEALRFLEMDLEMFENEDEVAAKLYKHVQEFAIYIHNNRNCIPNYGDRYR
jgi:hypothetical protein